jgi:hypothetical protein
VNEIQQNDVDRRHWFTLLAKRLRSSVGMAEAIDLATQLTTDNATGMELCMEDLVVMLCVKRILGMQQLCNGTKIRRYCRSFLLYYVCVSAMHFWHRTSLIHETSHFVNLMSCCIVQNKVML